MIYRFFMVLAGACVLGTGAHTLSRVEETALAHLELASLSLPEMDHITPNWSEPEQEQSAALIPTSPKLQKTRNPRSNSPSRTAKKTTAATDASQAFASAPTKSVGSGIASVYSYKSGKTASGEHSRPSSFTAAHRTLPFGTMVQVTNRRNGRAVVVRVNDRGPFLRGRVIDVTPAAARALGFSSLAPVMLSVTARGESHRRDS